MALTCEDLAQAQQLHIKTKDKYIFSKGRFLQRWSSFGLAAASCRARSEAKLRALPNWASSLHNGENHGAKAQKFSSYSSDSTKAISAGFMSLPTKEVNIFASPTDTHSVIHCSPSSECMFSHFADKLSVTTDTGAVTLPGARSHVLCRDLFYQPSL